MADSKHRPPGVKNYRGSAGGWSALKAATAHLREQQIVMHGHRTLLSMNKPDGFDCPGCAWPDSNPHGSFEYCENGAKAVAWEATRRRASPDLFDRWTISALNEQSDHWLEDQGRLTTPMRYCTSSDKYVAVGWDEACRDIGQRLAALELPDQGEYYTSGRTSNEAAFLLQLMVRLLGTNNFPDCSNLCHEASSVGLPRAIGVGKGTVSLEDFERCDAIFSFGHNPGTNHPRMLGTLRDAARRGVKIVVFNPLRERGLQKFRDPQRPADMLAGRSTMLATDYFQVKVGGDIAAVNGLIKALLAIEGGIDDAFIAEHTRGFDELRSSIERLTWPEIVEASGLRQHELESAAALYANSPSTIIAYGMGITQHQHGTDNVRALANLALLGGNIGRPGAGICPVRGHSNVQGDRTMGIWEKPSAAFLDAMEKTFDVPMPRKPGHTVVETIRAMQNRTARAFVAMGGNMVSASPEPQTVMAGLRGLDLTVSIATKLNRSHLAVGKTAYLLPCLGRTELDLQRSGPQSVSVEDSMSMVHASRGVNAPASPELRSECSIVAEIAMHALPDSAVDWPELVADYGKIRELIGATIPGFENFNERLRVAGGFALPNNARHRQWKTASGKAEFAQTPIPINTNQTATKDTIALTLTTVRSHDQYNTTIYGFDDRYRGVTGRRDVLFMNAADLERFALHEGQQVNLTNSHDRQCTLEGLTLVRYDIPDGCCATYFPEANSLIALDQHDQDSTTPAYKSVPVLLTQAS